MRFDEFVNIRGNQADHRRTVRSNLTNRLIQMGTRLREKLGNNDAFVYVGPDGAQTAHSTEAFDAADAAKPGGPWPIVFRLLVPAQGDLPPSLLDVTVTATQNRNGPGFAFTIGEHSFTNDTQNRDLADVVMEYWEREIHRNPWAV